MRTATSRFGYHYDIVYLRDRLKALSDRYVSGVPDLTITTAQFLEEGSDVSLALENLDLWVDEQFDTIACAVQVPVRSFEGEDIKSRALIDCTTEERAGLIALARVVAASVRQGTYEAPFPKMITCPSCENGILYKSSDLVVSLTQVINEHQASLPINTSEITREQHALNNKLLMARNFLERFESYQGSSRKYGYLCYPFAIYAGPETRENIYRLADHIGGASCSGAEKKGRLEFSEHDYGEQGIITYIPG